MLGVKKGERHSGFFLCGGFMQIFNTMTRRKEEFIPRTPRLFRIYVCGPTVYNRFHLGNARPFVVFDTLRRYLEYCGNEVIYIQNFTDIDDRMIRIANEEGITVNELADHYIGEYFIDADGLNIKRATVHPRATESIPAMLDMIKVLEDKGYAYVTSTGVYFDMQKFSDYGKLSGHDVENLEAGGSQRVDASDDKRNAMDFALWKFQKEGEPGYESPWGMGRPGWHIECSAMAKQYLGDTIDLHAGGQDLVFPHHENEIAQSEAANDKEFSRYWMHNGFVNVNQEKMAKSAGNFLMVRELAKTYPYEIIRFFILQAHYRMPVNFSDDLLDAAVSSFERIKTSVSNLFFAAEHASGDINQEATSELDSSIKEAKAEWHRAMDDDLNTADAIAAIFELVRASNQGVTASAAPDTLIYAAETIIELLEVMGLDVRPKEKAVPEDVLTLVDARAEAKKARNFAEADRLRDEIAEKGYKIEDTPQGPKLIALGNG
jgi:cysteinyl-tRNA synthetase